LFGVLLLDSPPAGAQQAAKAAPGLSPTQQKALLTQYCTGCHNQRLKTGGLALDQVDFTKIRENAEVLEHVVRKVRAGMMPPSGLPRPNADAFEAWIVSVENELDRNATPHIPPPGLHRLNRTEYANVIRDLLGLEIDPGKYLPSDDSTRGFDNIAGALTISPALMEGYISAAGKISRLAMGSTTAPVEAVFRVPEDTSQDYHIEGLPFGTRGGMLIPYEFPADGEYSVKITPISKGNMGNTNPFGEIPGEKLELLLDGERLKVFEWDRERARADGTFNFRFPATAGPHMVGVTFQATHYAPGNDLNKHFLRSTLETGGLPGFRFFPHIGKVTINGPYNAKGAGDTPSRQKILVCKPANANQETACARQVLSTLARRAYRRPVTNQDTETLMSFYQRGRNGGTFESGIEMGLRRILTDPDFVFRKEAEPPNARPGQKYRLSDLELASRLSFFLWSSIPDDELLNAASQNKLRDPAVLEQQVKRMLADPRSSQLVTNFAGQWLYLRALQTQIPVANLYPDFDDNLRNAMRREAELFVQSIVQEDRSVTDLLNANYTFVNERLARHYGIPNVYGSHFRRVTLPAEFDMRRGLLGKGFLLTVSSQPARTSPVNRGVTVMRVFLGTEPPAPPPNVPDLPVQQSNLRGGAKPTMRQQMEAHRANQVCAACHKIMDPIGLALENFDAIGQWRTTEDGSPIDPSGVLVDGARLNGVADLRQALVRYAPQFVRVVAEKLMIYALGRGTEYYDMPLVRAIVHDAERNNYKFSSLVLGVVKSEPFQYNMKVEDTQVAAR
jgi:cytochrome c551/c552